MIRKQVRSISFPNITINGFGKKRIPSFQGSTRTSPVSTERGKTPRCGKERLDEFLESCSNLQAALRPERRVLEERLEQRKSRSMDRVDWSKRSGGWRDKESYATRREVIKRNIDRRNRAQSEKEMYLVNAFISVPGTRRTSLIRKCVPKPEISYNSLRNERVRTLLSLNKREFGQPFDLSQIQVIQHKSAFPQILHFPEEDDNVVLKREIQILQSELLFKSAKKSENADLKPRETTQKRDLDVGMESLGPLSQFIIKEGSKYNTTWLRENRRFRERKMQRIHAKPND